MDRSLAFRPTADSAVHKYLRWQAGFGEESDSWGTPRLNSKPCVIVIAALDTVIQLKGQGSVHTTMPL